MALGRLGDSADGDCLLVEAVGSPDRRAGASDRVGRVVAMLSLVPWGNNGLSLDLMRRSPQSPNGTIELMVTELLQNAEEHWGQPHLAELRDVPRGLRAGRPARRRPGRPAVAGAAGVLLEVVAAGDAVPVQHEVPAGLGTAVRLLRGRPADPAGRRRLGHRRGLPGAAVLPAQQAAHRPPLGGALHDLAATGRLHADGSAPDPDEARRPNDRRREDRGCPTRCGCGWPS